ncbi:beta-N-acetylhexosaminidase [Streptomyces endophyticus]|uniref:Family 20 glycosylhydrolase n=1 Tax=Streptomyces endophyticus TaxID=714166 RepID=A0ABU6FJL4_9ACTN|nr:glycoside hydrolase family 20 protein [Streptomyces endophyticus]MEB8343787.1 family 20 glycosylhydrolase [Streptomyces endophyticus]
MLNRRSAIASGVLAGAAVFMEPLRGAGVAAAAPRTGGGPALPTIPAVRDVTTGRAAWRPTAATRIVVAPGAAGRLRGEARTLAAELVGEGHLDRQPRIVVTSSNPRPADIALGIGPVRGTSSPDAYDIVVRSGPAITGHSPAGVYYGTRTLLQVLRQQRTFSGRITDWPSYAQRGLMVDVGRKYFTVDWLKDRIRELGWLKLNVLQLHLSDSLGFRIESESHPEVTTRPALSKAQVRELLALAEQHHVTIVPEIDSPGHMVSILQAHPELQLVRKDGTRDPGNLDYSKPRARRLMRDLLTEYAELFPGQWFHLGGDEYFGYPWDSNKITGENAPQLLEYAREQVGPEATLLDGFTSYMNELIGVLAGKGKRAKVWNDHLVPGQGLVELDRRAEVEVWIRWNEDEPSVEDYVRAGYRVVNRHGDYLYFILAPDQQHETGPKSAQGIYDLWTPRTFMRKPTEDMVLADGAPMAGSLVSVWCDNPDFQTQQQVSEAVRPWLRAFGQQMWGSPKPTADYAGFLPLIEAVGDAPHGG